jgi:hypothetical protein
MQPRPDHDRIAAYGNRKSKVVFSTQVARNERFHKPPKFRNCVTLENIGLAVRTRGAVVRTGVFRTNDNGIAVDRRRKTKICTVGWIICIYFGNENPISHYILLIDINRAGIGCSIVLQPRADNGQRSLNGDRMSEFIVRFAIVGNQFGLNVGECQNARCEARDSKYHYQGYRRGTYEPVPNSGHGLSPCRYYCVQAINHPLLFAIKRYG